MMDALFFGFILGMISPSLAEVPKYTLNNGRQMPAIALGTYLGSDKIPQNKPYRDVISEAIDIGYRQFDTASIYGTEAEIGEGVRRKIQEGVVTREDMFITTKVWNTHHKREQVFDALNDALDNLGLEYIDLYLMHWPIGLNIDYTYSDVDYMDTWRAMEDAQRMGLTKSIGVCNFNKQQLRRLITESRIKPAVLQIEGKVQGSVGARRTSSPKNVSQWFNKSIRSLFRIETSNVQVAITIIELRKKMALQEEAESLRYIHPQIIQTELVNYAQSQNIVVMGFSPLGSLVMRYGIDFPGPKMDSPVLVGMARKYGKTTPQIVLRWLVDRNIVPVTKTVKSSRLMENINIFDFKLDPEEIKIIYGYDCGTRYTLPSFWQTHPYYPFEKIANPIADPFGNNK